MMSKWQKYSAYKDSGIEWLGEIPEEWNTLANKYIFKLKKNLVGKKSNEYNLLSLTLKGIIKRDMENPEGKFPAEFDTYQEVKKDDFVFCLFDVEETPRTVGLSKYDGMITGAYTVMSANDMNKDYLYYFYLNLDSNKRLKALYKGLRNTIPKDNFFSFKTFFPPKQEQEKIASFLDKKTSQIDKAINQKEKLIELLKEYRQIIINEAVTKGVDENGKLRVDNGNFKDSGIEWIGRIPKAWEISKLGKILKPISTKNRPELPLLSVTREQGVILRDIEDKDSNHNFIPDDLSPYKVVKKGQFAMNKMKAWQGSYGVSDYTGIVSPAYYIFEINDIEPDFFHKAIRSSVYIPFFIQASDGVRIGQWDLSKSRMKEIPFYIPPKKEQEKIVIYIDNQTTKIDKALHLQQNYIEKLKEYKATLIDSVVTGKVRVK